MPRHKNSLPCEVVLLVAASGKAKSVEIRELVEGEIISRSCGAKALRIIRERILMNGRRRR